MTQVLAHLIHFFKLESANCRSVTMGSGPRLLVHASVHTLVATSSVQSCSTTRLREHAVTQVGQNLAKNSRTLTSFGLRLGVHDH